MRNDLLNCKVILVSQLPLPFSKIGSWTTLYKNYICSDFNQIDYIVCERSSEVFNNVKYSFVKNNLVTKIYRKFTDKRYLSYTRALEEIVDNEEKYIIQIVDNFGIVKHIVAFLENMKIWDNCCIQFFYHGYPPFLDHQKSDIFFESINEMILLTHESYLVHKKYYKSLPCKIEILHNGIDNKRFYKLDERNKTLYKKRFNVSDKKIFVWCSQDRPKKGLHIVLEAWKKVYKKHKNIELWIIGCDSKSKQEGVTYFGKIPNDNIATYLQTADCYLFSSLCQEGFPLSLTEALHCGCYCIASSMGGVPEVLQYGKLGKLIENPHFVSEWEGAIEEFLKKPLFFEKIPENLYSSESWNRGMNNIIDNAKNSIQ